MVPQTTLSMTSATSPSTTLSRMNPTWTWSFLALWVEQIRCCLVQWAEPLVLGTPSSCSEETTGNDLRIWTVGNSQCTACQKSCSATSRIFRCEKAGVYRFTICVTVWEPDRYKHQIFDSPRPCIALLSDQWVAMPSSVLTCASSGLMLMQMWILPWRLHQETFTASLWRSCSKSCKTRWEETLGFIKTNKEGLSCIWATWPHQCIPSELFKPGLFLSELLQIGNSTSQQPYQSSTLISILSLLSSCKMSYVLNDQFCVSVIYLYSVPTYIWVHILLSLSVHHRCQISQASPGQSHSSPQGTWYISDCGMSTLESSK